MSREFNRHGILRFGKNIQSLNKCHCIDITVTQTKDSDPAFGATVYEIIEAAVAEYNYPVCYDFPVSHDKENYAIKNGMAYALEVTAKKVSLKEV